MCCVRRYTRYEECGVTYIIKIFPTKTKNKKNSNKIQIFYTLYTHENEYKL